LANRIGIDLDNTILKYDEVFHFLALEQSWIDQDCYPDKDAVKKALSKKADDSNQSENRWRQLQAWAYGSHIEKALVFDGFFDFVRQVQLCGDRLFIVSHKTEFSNYDPSVPLRDAALNTLDQRGFFNPVSEGGLGFARQDIFFASSLDDKIENIKELNLTHFIDDLPKVICYPGFPSEIRKILFSSTLSKKENEIFVFPVWKDIEEYFSLTNWLEKSFQSSLSSFQLLTSSGNNRIYKVKLKDGRNYAVKQYLNLKEDSRPRLQAEFGHLNALWKLDFQNIPKPILTEGNWAVYSLVEGAFVKSVELAEMDEVLSFLSRLSDVSSKLREFSILPGSDSRSCLGDYIDQIERRYNRLVQGANTSGLEKEINDFLEQKFLPHKEFIFRKFYDSIESLGWDLQIPFTEEQQMFSPSDLGFHNILASSTDKGKLVFLDFEYSGWDDPAKLLADFFHHVGQNITWEHKWHLLERFAVHRTQDPDFLRRWDIVIDMIGLEWVLIVLNVIDPKEMKRKRFANPNLDPVDLIKTRVSKANQMINEMSERMERGEEKISIPSRKQVMKY
jgi:thiamine kinase-like enzyme